MPSEHEPWDGPSRRPAALPRVLVVEDGHISRTLAKAILEHGSFEVETADNGLEAASAVARGGRYDLILMDLDMPVMDGFEATTTIRALGAERGGDTPIMALSALAGDGHVANARSHGMMGHIAKPYDPGRLLDTVRQAIAPSAPGAAATRDPVLETERYHDLARRLGTAKLEAQLQRVEAELRSVLAAVGTDPTQVSDATAQAHRLISTAGVLGFAELVSVCRRAQAATTLEAWRSAAPDLAAALRRALDRPVNRAPLVA